MFRIVTTKNLNPWRNLAVEEYLLDNVQENQCILYLWQNQNTVVIGKNQNPWRECRTKLLEEENAKLARRISGGGAVFHDIGNLNFTFVVDRKLYDLQKQLRVILEAVQNLGISAEFSGRNDITVDGRKFSGNAFCFRAKSAFHHGTIMLHADIEKLTRYLQVSEEKIRSKGIKSVQSRVVNLCEHQPDLSVDKMIQELQRSFQCVYGTAEISDAESIQEDIIDDLYQKYSSWQWLYGESPSFDIELDTRFSWGGIHLGLQVENAVIEKAFLYSDAMDEEFIEIVRDSIPGEALSTEKIAQKVLQLGFVDTRKNMAEDIASWLRTKKI